MLMVDYGFEHLLPGHYSDEVVGFAARHNLHCAIQRVEHMRSRFPQHEASVAVIAANIIPSVLHPEQNGQLMGLYLMPHATMGRALPKRHPSIWRRLWRWLHGS